MKGLYTTTRSTLAVAISKQPSLPLVGTRVLKAYSFPSIELFNGHSAVYGILTRDFRSLSHNIQAVASDKHPPFNSLPVSKIYSALAKGYVKKHRPHTKNRSSCAFRITDVWTECSFSRIVEMSVECHMTLTRVLTSFAVILPET